MLKFAPKIIPTHPLRWKHNHASNYPPISNKICQSQTSISSYTCSLLIEFSCQEISLSGGGGEVGTSIHSTEDMKDISQLPNFYHRHWWLRWGKTCYGMIEAHAHDHFMSALVWLVVGMILRNHTYLKLYKGWQILPILKTPTIKWLAIFLKKN